VHTGEVRVRLTGMELSPRDRAILDFERSWWQQKGAKESAIREQLGLSGTRYYEILQHLCDSRAARAYDPLVIHRLRRLRDRRRRARFEGPSAGRPPAR
jgi:hypothetical protein